MKRELVFVIVSMLYSLSALAYSNSINSLRNFQFIGSYDTQDSIIQQRMESSDKIIQIMATNNLSADVDFSDEGQDSTYTLKTAKGCTLNIKIVKFHNGGLNDIRKVEILDASENCKRIN